MTQGSAVWRNGGTAAAQSSDNIKRMNQSYEDDACADVDEYVPTDGTEPALPDRRSTHFNPKFIQPSSPKPISSAQDSPPSVATPSQRGDEAPVSPFGPEPVEPRESMATVRVSEEFARPEMKTFEKSMGLSTAGLKPSLTSNGRPSRGLIASHTQPDLMYGGEIAGGRAVFMGGRTEHSMRSLSPPMPLQQPSDLDMDTRSNISRSIRPRVSGKLEGFSEKEYARVMKEIMADASDSDRRKLLSPEMIQQMEEYMSNKERQKSLAQRLETSHIIRENKQNMLAQMEDLQKLKECTFTPQLESRQIADRSLNEFLSSQEQHLYKKELKLQQLSAQIRSQEQGEATHKPATLTKSAQMTRNREKSPFERLYSIKNENLKKQAANMIAEESDEEERSLISQKQKKAKPEAAPHQPAINARSKKLKRDQPIGEHLYAVGLRKAAQRQQPQKEQAQTFVNTKSQKMLEAKFRTEYNRAVERVLREREEARNPMEEDAIDSRFQKQNLLGLFEVLGFVRKPASGKERLAIEDFFPLCQQNKTDQAVEQNALYQLLSALAGFQAQYISKRGPSAAAGRGEMSPDVNEQTMTLQFYDELRGEKPVMDTQQDDASQQMTFQPIVSNLQERFETLAEVSRESIFTTEGRLQMSETLARKLGEKFAVLSKNRREFERNRKREDDGNKTVNQSAVEETFKPVISHGSQKLTQNRVAVARLEAGGPAVEQRVSTLEPDEPRELETPQSAPKEKRVQSGKKSTLLTTNLHSISKAQERAEKIKQQKQEKFEQECTFRPQRLTSTRSQTSLGQVRTTERLYNLAKKGQEREEEFERKREEMIQARLEGECTFKPTLMKSTSVTDIKNPYWAKNIDKTVSRLKQARKAQEQKQRLLSRGVPGCENAPGAEPSLNFALEKNYKPSFNDMSKGRKKNTRGRDSDSRNDLRKLAGQSQERLNTMLSKNAEKAKIVAMQMGHEDLLEEAKEAVAAEQRRLQTGSSTGDRQWTQERKFLPTISSNGRTGGIMPDSEQSQTGAQTSNNPLLYVDIALNDEKTHRILVFSGDRPEDLAAEFSNRHGLDDKMRMQLEKLIYTKIAAVFQNEEYSRVQQPEEGALEEQQEAVATHE